jgi:hypothetical protein
VTLERIGAAWLPGMLVVAGLALLVCTPLAWGVGSRAGLSDWQPPMVGLAFAVPSIVFGAATLRGVDRKARLRCTVHLLPLLFAVPILFGLALAVAGLAVSLPDPSTYNSLVEAPAVTAEALPSVVAAQRGVQLQGDLSPAGFLAIALLVIGFLVAWMSAACYVYTSAFTAEPRMRFESRQEQEIDGVGMMLRGQRGPGTRP